MRKLAATLVGLAVLCGCAVGPNYKRPPITAPERTRGQIGPVEAASIAAWFGSGLICGAAGLLLPDLLTSLDYSALTFLVIASLAAALIGLVVGLATMAGDLAVAGATPLSGSRGPGQGVVQGAR